MHLPVAVPTPLGRVMTDDDGYRGYWYAEASRLNSLLAHHAGSRAMADLECEQLRSRIAAALEIVRRHKNLCCQLDIEGALSGASNE
jgi:hypothetical protein